MPSPLVRLVGADGQPVLVHPNRVTGIVPTADAIDANGATPRSLIYVGVPHLVANGRALTQAWDTLAYHVLGTPDAVTAQLWPQEAKA